MILQDYQASSKTLYKYNYQLVIKNLKVLTNLL